MAKKPDSNKNIPWNVNSNGGAEKARKKKAGEVKKKGNPKWLKPLIDFFDSEKSARIFGLFTLLLSLFLLLSFSSYFFTGRYDFNLIRENGIVDFIFDSDIEVENWMGNLGGAVAHFFMYRGFGISSLVFPFLLFLIGFKLLFGFSLLSLKKSFKHGFFHLIWISISLGLVLHSTDYKFLFGQFGYQIDQWMFRIIGKIGALFVVIALLFSYLVISFNFSLTQLRQLLSPIKMKGDLEEEDASTLDLSSLADQNLEIEEVSDADSVENDADPEQDSSEDEDAIEPDSSVELEVEAPPPSEEIPTKDGEPDFSVEDKADEVALSEKDVNEALKNFGPYDPTLDLPKYLPPTLDLLEDHGTDRTGVDKEELEENKNRIVSSLENYSIKIQSIKATIGPTVTLYEIVPEAGVRISKIKNLEDDIALSLAALGIRIIAPIPGKGTIGIEVPNKNPEIVSMRSVITSPKFQESSMDLPVVMGKTISNESFVFDLAKMPHLLMAGATGQGKSVGLNVVLTSLLYKKHPSQLKFVLVDPKKVELTLYNKIERHFLAKLPGSEDAIITDNQKVIHTLNSLCVEMDQRYELLKEAFVRNIKEYNSKFVARKLNPEQGHRYLPYIVLVVDEFADLIMTAGKEVETPIARLAQLARAIGIHLIIATQRPSTNIITGSIKANFPARIAFRVTSGIDSRTILDAGGAEQLIGRGDMLLSTGSNLIRIQSAFVDTPEVEAITEFIGSQQGYPDALILPEYQDESTSGGSEYSMDDRDDLFDEAARLIVQHQQGSASLLQRRLKLGYNRAGRIIDQLEALGIIGPFEGSKARKVLVQDEQTLNLILNPDNNANLNENTDL
ncbi:MAG: DNA translocase FtsK 4TM domain-containing protein [Vicingaceae bacterium]